MKQATENCLNSSISISLSTHRKSISSLRKQLGDDAKNKQQMQAIINNKQKKMVSMPIQLLAIKLNFGQIVLNCRANKTHH